MNRSKVIGTRGETAVVRYLADNGFPHAERRALAGGEDRGDVLAHLGLVFEVKSGASAKDAGCGTIATWLREAEVERVNAGATFGLLVVQRVNRTLPGPGGWACHLPMWALVELATGGTTSRLQYMCEPVCITFAAAVELLRRAGYGDAIAEVA